jgi:uncharacterized membrane protein
MTSPRDTSISLVTIAFDAPLALADYRECRELGGFILIDRLTNDTVALGLVERSLDEGPTSVAKEGGRETPGRFNLSPLITHVKGWLYQAQEKPLRSIAKAITWRTTGSVDTFLLSFIFTGSAKISAAISISEIATKLALYYGHERVWAHSKFGLRSSAGLAEQQQSEMV